MEKVGVGTNTKGIEAQPQPAPTGAENRAARKLMELEAGRVLVAQAAKQAEEARAKLEEERSESKSEEREQRDTPELSRQSKWFGIEGKLLMEANLRWILEMEQELWEALLNWQPSSSGNLSKDLEELSRLYLALLEAVLIHTTGQEQTVQKERLDAVLSEKLNLVLEVKLKNLISLLERMGQRETIDQIRHRVYKRTTGESISPKAAERFFSSGSGVGKGHASAVSSHGVTEASGKAFGEEGSVYQAYGGRNVRVSQEFDAHRKSGQLEMNQRSQAFGEARGGSRESGGFGIDELVRADAFARHLSESGRILEGMGTLKGNQEVVGYLAALTSIKGEIYLSGNGRSGDMASPVKSLVNQMVDYYLNQKGAYEAYYHTTGIYEKTKDAQRAASEGLAYAYRLFLEKKGDAAYRNQRAYSEEAGFFQMLGGRTLEEDFRRGTRLLEENWRGFLAALGQEGRGITLRAQRYSPWGAVMEAEERRKARDQKAEKVFVRQMLVVVVLVAGYLLWRMVAG
ncbi:MAG: hypothetical protein HFI20_11455 [Lachnospiraceae bacterium]|nr:hypothetical protein [Lachnospiraceae bacterium]